jgi:DNA-binding beta-propeller fold protein YncE
MLRAVGRLVRPGLGLVALGAAAAGCGGGDGAPGPAVTAAPALRAVPRPRVVSPRTWVSHPRLARVTARVRLRHGPTSLGFGSGGLWVTRDDGRLSFVDPRSNQVKRTTRTGRFPVGVAFAGDAVWIANSEDDTVSRFDARTGRRAQTVRVGDAPSDLAVGARAVWVANGLDDTVTRLDARTGRVQAVLHVGEPPLGVRTIAAGPDGVWVTGRDVLVRIDPRSNRIVGRLALDSPSGPALTHDGLWIASEDGRTVTRLDRRSGRRQAVVRVGSNPTFVAADDRFAWVLNNGEGTVTQIDALTNRVVGTIPVGGPAFQLVVGAGAVWVQGYGGRAVVRIDPR